MTTTDQAATATPAPTQTSQRPDKPTTRVLTQLRTLTRYNLTAFRRNPAASFFTVGLPVLFLLIFTSIFGNEMVNLAGDVGGANEEVRLATFYVPGILALAVVSATLVNLPITNTFRRENGMLKRLRGSPLRPSTYITSELISGFLLVLLMTVVLVGLGWIIFDVSIGLTSLPTILLTLLIASLACSALGLALCSIIASETAAPAVTNMFVLPLYFVSDVFYISDESTAKFITLIGDIFPIKHLAGALGDGFNPNISGVSWPWSDWAVLAAWGAFGTIVAVRHFRWLPRKR